MRGVLFEREPLLRLDEGLGVHVWRAVMLGMEHVKDSSDGVTDYIIPSSGSCPPP